MRKQPILFSGIAFGLLLLGIPGCNTVPVTGRTAINMVSDEYVIKESIRQFDLMKSQYPLSKNLGYIKMVREVGEKVIAAASTDIYLTEWEFLVFENPSIFNAFAMPGGKIGVFTGLFKAVKTDGELAIVIGHEIAHMTAKHVNERLSKQKLSQAGRVGLAIITSGQSSLVQGAILDTYGLGCSMGGLGFNRKMEKEADEIGLIYAARAGYNPTAAYALWERILAENSNLALSKPLSTHPSYLTRIRNLREAMPEAIEEYEITQSSVHKTNHMEGIIIQ
ncbi:MAG: Beta-barrel assembly-enhancing protease [Candidatus Moanabacter tarae]|uniref:Beta-barrel assembly-enhancing protease n=1 Tax=Candidatus Moanibacter tarae TaxID=2200854 RepID=A0A2Z4AJH8_9BACT|nr:MAG: Beta-barrel assembly-enhancing protease [Candidatus Moanabacter tarae]|tara:strand:+ start:11464 stop:12300 length:837 start_codon:yes stop_codon:yes gene_type:complete